MFDFEGFFEFLHLFFPVFVFFYSFGSWSSHRVFGVFW